MSPWIPPEIHLHRLRRSGWRLERCVRCILDWVYGLNSWRGSPSPKWREEEWKSIGQILVEGFQDHGYFLCRLFPVFTAALIFSDNAVSDATLLESLPLYLCRSDKDLITTSLKEDFSGRDRGELLDLLDSLDVTTLPTSENLKKASFLKQLIQKPRYAAAKKKNSFIAGNFLKEAFLNSRDVLLMYEDKKTTTRNLLKSLDTPPATQAENKSFCFL